MIIATRGGKIIVAQQGDGNDPVVVRTGCCCKSCIPCQHCTGVTPYAHLLRVADMTGCCMGFEGDYYVPCVPTVDCRWYKQYDASLMPATCDSGNVHNAELFISSSSEGYFYDAFVRNSGQPVGQPEPSFVRYASTGANTPDGNPKRLCTEEPNLAVFNFLTAPGGICSGGSIRIIPFF